MSISKLLCTNLHSLLVVALTTTPAFADFIFTPISGSSHHQFSSPYSGKFRAINGDSFDVSHYYASSSTELNVNGLAMWKTDDGLSITVPWSFDLGYKSDLFETNPVLQLGLSVEVSSARHSFRFGISNLVIIGGNLTERACTDSLFRDFHCGTGLPWVDRPSPNKNDTKVFSINYRLDF